MPATRDVDSLRRLMAADAAWCVYPLGDLAPERVGQGRWFLNAEQDALVLFYGEFGTPILFATGCAENVDGLLKGARLPESVYLHVRPELMPVMERHFRVVKRKEMLRMVLACETPGEGDAERLTIADVGDLRKLYADGATRGEEPDFFFDSMVEDGYFHGVREDGEIVSVAGTHIAEVSEGVAAIGNVYTNHAYRRRGYGRRVMLAVIAKLQETGIGTIALSVHQGNAAAIHLYERLGFRRHCEFVEGTGVRLC